MKDFFDYWNRIDPEKFLLDDLRNPSRAWAAETVRRQIARGARSVVEVGPGSGVDYDRHFRVMVAAGEVDYTGWEGSQNFRDRLAAKYPESVWTCAALLDLPAGAHDVVYVRHVLEHQPSLVPSLPCVLAAARRAVVLVWYRPPAAMSSTQQNDGVYYCTFRRRDVDAVLDQRGWCISEQVFYDTDVAPPLGNLCWLLERK